MARTLFFFLAALAAGLAYPDTPSIRPELLTKPWAAEWIAAPGAAPQGYGVYHFRKRAIWDERPEKVVVHVSADNRYKLFVNGELAALGPARGDYFHWRFDTVDLAPFLRQGENIVAAVVWNDGEHRPEAQISHRTGFILQGNTERDEILNTNSSWKSYSNRAYAPLPGVGYPTYYVSGPGEIVDFNAYPNAWRALEFDDSDWAPATSVWPKNGNPKGARDKPGWMLVPREIPPLQLRQERLRSVRSAEGADAQDGFLRGEASVVVPARSKATLLLDQGWLTNAFPTLAFSGGAGATLELSYAEALFESAADLASGDMRKGDRDVFESKVFAGRTDRILPSGARGQRFTALAWRTFRYVQLTVETADEPLALDDFYGTFVGYPFEKRSRLELGRDDARAIEEIGWRTARMCAIETYMDCPYYEQLQYIGDTRIQGLVSLYNTDDDRLLRNALDQMDQSRIAEGITMSRHPSSTPQIIPTFSLWYIGMLHDYWMYGDDAKFVADKLSGARQILEFFERHQRSDGSLTRPPYWLFTDWVEGRPGWDFGEPPFGPDGRSALLDFQLLWACQLASQLEAELGMPAFAECYSARARQLQETIRSTYWNADTNRFSDTPGGELYSQHANALAILTDTIQGENARALAERLPSDADLAPASIYFRYYLHQALAKAGLGDSYIDWLDTWRENISLGLTTWAETSDVSGSRSDCHAWGSSPNIEFFRIVLGIDSAAPGFARVRIEPRLGKLTQASGSIPHPRGEVSVEYEYAESSGWRAGISLPEGVEGILVWAGRELPLASGANAFVGADLTSPSR